MKNDIAKGSKQLTTSLIQNLRGQYNVFFKNERKCFEFAGLFLRIVPYQLLNGGDAKPIIELNTLTELIIPLGIVNLLFKPMFMA